LGIGKTRHGNVMIRYDTDMEYHYDAKVWQV